MTRITKTLVTSVCVRDYVCMQKRGCDKSAVKSVKALQTLPTLYSFIVARAHEE